MNKPTISLNKTVSSKDKEEKGKLSAGKPATKPSVKKEARPSTKPKKDKAPKTWEEALVKWRGGDKEPAPIQCIVYQLVGMAYSQKRPELMDMIPEDWQERAKERYADKQFLHQK